MHEHFLFTPDSHLVFCGDKSIIAADFLIDDNAHPTPDVDQRTVKPPVLGERSFDGQLLEEDVVGALRHVARGEYTRVDERA
jgi:hypothetical protein